MSVKLPNFVRVVIQNEKGELLVNLEKNEIVEFSPVGK